MDELIEKYIKRFESLKDIQEQMNLKDIHATFWDNELREILDILRKAKIYKRELEKNLDAK